MGTLVGPGGKSLLATVVKSDTVLVDFSMTALDYLKSKERNINLGQQDSTVPGNRTLLLLWRILPYTPIKDMLILRSRRSIPRQGTFSVRAEMPNLKTGIASGQFTKVKLLLDVREGAIVVSDESCYH